MHFILYIVWILIAGGSIYVILTAVNAYVQTKAAPRVDMFLCDIHGPIPREGVIKFMEMDSCGICFHDRMRKAERGQL